ncbi:MAG TPA: hypothetical protein VMU95_39995 [Trebonia sp.]|nr:hypothetical protein [Trebonia sp.]
MAKSSLEPLKELLAAQGNCVTHEQAVEQGQTRHHIVTHLGRGRLMRLYRGVFYAGSEPVPRVSQLWGAVLRVGHGGVISHETAAELFGFADGPSDSIHVSVPRTAGRLPESDGIKLHYSARLPMAVFKPAPGYVTPDGQRMPPVTYPMDAVLDIAHACPTEQDAVSWAIRACQRGATTPDVLAMWMLKPGRRGLRWRTELTDALADIRAGVQSPLELRYLRDVEQAHALPQGERQVKTHRGTSVQFHDVRYPAYGVGVELDGVNYHRGDAVDRDIARDNSSVLSGVQTLRYGWLRVAYHPCEVAYEVWTLLVRNGLEDDFHPCGPACQAPASPRTASEVRSH